MSAIVKTSAAKHLVREVPHWSRPCEEGWLVPLSAALDTYLLLGGQIGGENNH